MKHFLRPHTHSYHSLLFGPLAEDLHNLNHLIIDILINHNTQVRTDVCSPVCLYSFLLVLEKPLVSQYLSIIEEEKSL